MWKIIGKAFSLAAAYMGTTWFAIGAAFVVFLVRTGLKVRHEGFAAVKGSTWFSEALLALAVALVIWGPLFLFCLGSAKVLIDQATTLSPPGGIGGFAVVNSSDVHITHMMNVDSRNATTTSFAGKEVVVNETINLPELAAKGVSGINGGTFRNCRFIGPSVIWVRDGAALVNSQFSVPEGRSIEDAFVIVQTTSPLGIIRISASRFENCTFENVAIAGTAQEIAKIRASVVAP